MLSFYFTSAFSLVDSLSGIAFFLSLILTAILVSSYFLEDKNSGLGTSLMSKLTVGISITLTIILLVSLITFATISL